MRRRTPLKRTVLASTALLLVAAAAALLLPVERVVVARGALAGGTTAVRSPLDGRIARALVRPGERVRPGDPLLVLASDEIASGRAQSEARIAALSERARGIEAQIAHLRGVRHGGERSRAALALERARLRQEAAERRLEAQERLRPEGLVAEVAYEDARAERELARVAWEEARLVLEALPADQEAALAELEALLAETRSRLDELRLEAAELARREVLSTLVAPIAGMVLATDPQELAGRAVLAGEELLRLDHGEAERFEGVLGDLGRTRVREGMAVKLRIEGYPWLLHGTLGGRTTFVGTRGEGGSYPVLVALEGARRGLVLREGMGASARILVGEAVPLWRLLFERLAGSG